MRIFAAALYTESNGFSPVPTSLRSFREGIYWPGGLDGAPLDCDGLEAVRAWRQLAEDGGHEFVLGPLAFAEPSGPTVGPAYDWLKDQILAAVDAAKPVDVVLLNLHGAMLAEGCDDVEGDLIGALRERVGAETSIGVLIDPHAHLSERMVRASTVLAAYLHWPHTDVAERGRHVWGVALTAAQRRVRPVASVFDCRMISSFPTRPEPMASFVATMVETEAAPPFLSVSLIHGFPWADTLDTGVKLLVWTDGDLPSAEGAARRLGERLFALRDEVSLVVHLDMDGALDRVLSGHGAGLLVLCDMGDNVPGGAPGDATHFLRRALDRGVGDLCFGPLWDPMATAVCFDVGEGARLRLRLGGKSGASAGMPVDVTATVRALLCADSETTQRSPARRLGDRAWITLDQDIDVVLHDRRAATGSLETVTDLGLDPTTRRAFVGKMYMHGGAAFAPIAAELLGVATPGTLDVSFATLPITKRRTPWWPGTPNPFDDAVDSRLPQQPGVSTPAGIHSKDR